MQSSLNNIMLSACCDITAIININSANKAGIFVLQTDNRPNLLRYILRVQIVVHAVNLLLQDRVIFTAYMPSYSYQNTIIRSFIKILGKNPHFVSL